MAGAYTPISYVQVAGSGTPSSTGTQITATYSNASQISLGDTLIAVVRNGGSTAICQTASDTSGNTWVRDAYVFSIAAPGLAIMRTYVTNSISAGGGSNSVQFNLTDNNGISTSANYRYAYIYHFKGISSNPLDQVINGYGVSSPLTTPGFSSPAAKTSSLILIAAAVAGSTTSTTWGSGSNLTPSVWTGPLNGTSMANAAYYLPGTSGTDGIGAITKWTWSSSSYTSNYIEISYLPSTISILGSISESVTDTDTNESSAGIVITTSSLTTSHSSSGNTTTESVTGATILETISSVNNAESGVQALVGQPINIIGNIIGNYISSSNITSNLSTNEETKNTNTQTNATLNGSLLSSKIDNNITISNIIFNVVGSISSLLGFTTQQSSNSNVSGNVKQSIEAKSNPTAKSFISSIISASANTYNLIRKSTITKRINILESTMVNASKFKAIIIDISTIVSITNSKQRIKIILIKVNSRLNYVRNITKNIFLKIQDMFSHTQQLITNDWSLPEKLDPTDFAEANETEEFVEPTSTDFDYSLDENLDPPDAGVANGT